MLRLPRQPASAGAARHAIVERLTAHGVVRDGDVRDALRLVVSELVTNAVCHTVGDEVVVAVAADRHRVRVEVGDLCSALPRRREPEAEDEHGRGLLLVEALAARHGVSPTAEGKRCWAELDLPEHEVPGQAQPQRQAVILSAGFGTRIAIVSRGRPKATVTTGARPVLVSQLQQLHAAGVRHFVIVHAPGDDRQIRTLVEQVFAGAGFELRLVVQAVPYGPLNALAQAAPYLLPDGDVTLVLGDTLIGDLGALPPDSVAVSRVEAAQDYCVVGTDDAGRIIAYADKPQGAELSQHAVVGVYRFADSRRLRTLLSDEVPPQAELSVILRAYGAQRPLSAVPVELWWDLGSYDRYVTANRTSLSGRADHSFAVTDDGTVVKRGDGTLMAAQAGWYRSLPDTAAGLAPRLLGEGEGWYRIELMDYPSLAELLLFEPLPAATWRHVLARLLQVMESRLWAPTRRTDSGAAEWCERKYVDKTEQRLASWKHWDRVREERLVVNGVQLPAFDEVWPSAGNALRSLAATSGSSSLVHGDMTFSNILLTRGFGTFKLLDPGTTFSDTWGGDVRYDLAKLRQSYAGGYDALREDLFTLHRATPTSWALQVFPRPSPIAQVGDDLIAEAGFDIDEVRLLEATQFLSMVPLHHENSDRQYALYARGLMLLAAVLEGQPHALRF
ncbi:NTP transferase domain-containing protein [Streptomyces sp. TRM66268-LWL]|uniref:NTP transferase domain-containing protein n=1 Tax=Streptomyces polyasparticus TaxID=2767826 RepID=A0ABR7SUP7_9ACTN|nr:sugar phosphate nucleotidyltransferase [Streptomyces polyasparticus]MBC9717998.1 NTP transferase domain-containing protein [Streptomyces polyasparticus]